MPHHLHNVLKNTGYIIKLRLHIVIDHDSNSIVQIHFILKERLQE